MSITIKFKTYTQSNSSQACESNTIGMSRDCVKTVLICIYIVTYQVMMPYMMLCTINITRTQAKLKSSSGEGDLPTRLQVNPTSRLSNLAMIRVAIPRQVFGKRQEAAFSPLRKLLIKEVVNNIDMLQINTTYTTSFPCSGELEVATLYVHGTEKIAKSFSNYNVHLLQMVILLQFRLNNVLEVFMCTTSRN